MTFNFQDMFVRCGLINVDSGEVGDLAVKISVHESCPNIEATKIIDTNKLI